MALPQLLFSLLLLPTLHALSISVGSQKQRCMIVSSSDSTQLLKVDFKFTQFEGQAIEEGYRVVLHDTETHHQQVYQVQHGTFRKEFPLTPNVVYRLCFKIVLTSHRPITKLFEYHASLKHQFNTAEESIKVPEKLLRSKDLTQTYTYMDKTRELLRQLRVKADTMRREETEVFETQNERMSHLEWVSLFEVVVILGFGGYQYFKLKSIIENRKAS